MFMCERTPDIITRKSTGTASCSCAPGCYGHLQNNPTNSPYSPLGESVLLFKNVCLGSIAFVERLLVEFLISGNMNGSSLDFEFV